MSVIAATAFSFSEFVRANPGKGVTILDYIQISFSELEVSSDLLKAIGQLFMPTMRSVGGVLLLSSLGAEPKFRKYIAEGMSKKEAQYWANLTETTNLFGNLDFDATIELTNSIAESWSNVLYKNFPKVKEKARVVVDRDASEVFAVVTVVER